MGTKQELLPETLQLSLFTESLKQQAHSGPSRHLLARVCSPRLQLSLASGYQTAGLTSCTRLNNEMWGRSAVRRVHLGDRLMSGCCCNWCWRCAALLRSSSEVSRLGRPIRAQNRCQETQRIITYYYSPVLVILFFPVCTVSYMLV